MKYFIIFFLVLLSTGCNLFQGQQLAKENVAVEEKQVETFVPVEKELYVIDKEEREDNYLFGEKIKISAEGNEFYKTDRGDYIKKKDVGDWNTLKTKITTDDLIKNVDINGNSNDSISKYLSIDQISSEEYQEALKNKVDFLQRDTLGIVKKKGKLTFVCKQRTVYLKDDISELADKHFDMIYTYLGNIPAIDQYVVLEDTERSLAYILIDKTTGEKRRFDKFPFLSADKRYIINIGRDYYDRDRLISLYRIEHIKPLKIDTLVEGYTKSWDVYDLDKEPIFFSKNDYLYAPMNVVGNFFNEHNNPNKQRMYIKIGIKN